jgi:DNA polymerase
MPRTPRSSPPPPPQSAAVPVEATSSPAPPKTKGDDSAAGRQARLDVVKTQVAACTRCEALACTRKQTVFGVGNPVARVMFLGEAPGADEDKQGEPFVGRAGQLLNKIITAMKLRREDIYICNILRCRPPENRTPLPAEAANCREWLDAQLEIVDPDYIVCWGTCAAQNLLGVTDTIGRMRGRFYQLGRARVLCTYHPSYLLRNPEAKKPVWEDMQLLMQELGIAVD